MTLKPLPRSFYLRPTLVVARSLLGKLLVRRVRGQTFVGTIVEVEAYLGAADRASHAYRGITARNKVMFGEGGHLYVYFTYGMHYCANVVTEARGTGHAVLLRAVEPLKGVGRMRRNRSLSPDKDDRNIANGPAKLCQAFTIARAENGTDLTGKKIFIARGKPVARARVIASRRIGIRKAVDKPWRFSLEGHPCVSRLRSGAPP
jgi:DNA-3-methyladenine glycosylase